MATPHSIQSEISHVTAAIAGVEDSIRITHDRQSSGKRVYDEATLPIRESRLTGFRNVLRTLRAVDSDPDLRAAILEARELIHAE
jgi:hypothetical protein